MRKIRIPKIATSFILVCSFIVYVLLLASSAVVTGGDEHGSKTTEMKAADKNHSSLLLVVVGGFIGIVGSIGGGIALFKLQSRHEKKVFKRSKLEELLALAYQCDDWPDQLMVSGLIQGDFSSIIEKFPVNRMKMLQVLYFPSLKDEVQALADAVKEFRKLIILERPKLTKTHKYSDDFRERYDPKQKTVLRAIETLAQKAANLPI